MCDTEGISVQVLGVSNRGGRDDMEDIIGIGLQMKGRGQVFVAVFDGHGGKEAAHFAYDELWPAICSLDGFHRDDGEEEKKASAGIQQHTYQNEGRTRLDFYIVSVCIVSRVTACGL